MKSVVSILCFFFGLSAQAATYTLNISNHWGFERQDTIQIDRAGQMTFNGLPVSKRAVASVSPLLKTVSGFSSSRSRLCGSGQYSLQISESKKQRTVVGCSEGKEFAKLVGVFRQVQSRVGTQ